jgi:hypothetical protein
MPAADDAEWLLPEEWDKSNGANRGPVRKRATLMPSSSADSLLFDLLPGPNLGVENRRHH